MLSQGLHADGNSLASALEHAGARSLAAGSLARLRARVRARSLDRALIAGADPSVSPQLAARAAQLTSRRMREQIADGLERMVAVTQGPPRRWSAASTRGPALANTARLCELSALLRQGTPVYAHGVAILNQLLSDGGGPAYRGTGVELARELQSARSAAIGGC